MSSCNIVIYFILLDVNFIANSIAFGTDNIFNHFNELAVRKKLPNFEDVEAIARKLYRCYSTTRGLHRALHADLGPNDWTDFVPEGSPWNPSLISQSSLPEKTSMRQIGRAHV